jgi:flavodoxin
VAYKKDDQFDESRRNLLKIAIPGLIAGFAAPMLLSLPAARAAGTALDGKKVLTVYYSRSGNTRTMANYIQEVVGDEVVSIETVEAYPSEYRATTRQARKELDSGYKPPLKTKIGNMAEYDVLFVGSPCWWGTIATPVISFLSGYDFSGKTVVPFMTHKGSGLGRTMSHVRQLCSSSTVLQGKAIWGDDIGSSRGDVVQWLSGLNMA